MYFPTRMMVAEEHTRDDWNNVLFVIDVRQARTARKRRDVRINVVRKCLIADTGHAVGYSFELSPGWEMQREEDSVEKGDGSTKRVPNDGY